MINVSATRTKIILQYWVCHRFVYLCSQVFRWRSQSLTSRPRHRLKNLWHVVVKGVMDILSFFFFVIGQVRLFRDSLFRTIRPRTPIKRPRTCRTAVVQYRYVALAESTAFQYLPSTPPSPHFTVTPRGQNIPRNFISLGVCNVLRARVRSSGLWRPGENNIQQPSDFKSRVFFNDSLFQRVHHCISTALLFVTFFPLLWTI